MMEKLVILLVMLLCLFGPMTLFAIVGNKALTALGKRPSEGARVMIPFIMKITGACIVALALLMVILKLFGHEAGTEPVYRFRDFDWHRLQ